jgi:PIN domain nuclease of toxin-antitoxin system
VSRPILLDTCALLWWTLAPDALSPRALKACEAVEREGGAVSSISLWEIGTKAARGKLTLGTSFEDYASRVRSLATLEILPVTLETWLATVALDWTHRDPVDRVVVATAKALDAQLVTKDEKIRAHYKRCVW